jgi:uncharacterized pyridoxamine 5'-phosphate oxidase family protein
VVNVAVTEPATADSLLGEVAVPAEWSRAREYLGEATATYWLATAGRDGKPHVMPTLAVWVDGALFFCASEATRKIKNLALDPHCSISVEWERLDLVIEGTAVKVRDESTLKRVADEYDATYGWRVTGRDGAFHDTEGAPTAGPPLMTFTNLFRRSRSVSGSTRRSLPHAGSFDKLETMNRVFLEG